MKTLTRISMIVALALFLLSPFSANADIIQLSSAFSNFTPPQSGNYGTVELTDLGNTVQFDITLNSVLGTDRDLEWFYFNTTTDLATLSVISSTPGATLAYDFNNNTPGTYKADGDGLFDGRVDFGNGGTKYSSVTFILGSTTGGLDINDFLALSSGGSKGAYTVAIHAQSTSLSGSPATSEFIGGNPVPIPGAAWLLGSGLLGLIGFRRKFEKN
jgi:hypothetical protein